MQAGGPGKGDRVGQVPLAHLAFGFAVAFRFAPFRAKSNDAAKLAAIVACQPLPPHPPDPQSPSMKSALATLLLTLHCFAHDASAALFDKEIVITEGEIQAAIDKNGRLEKRAGTMLAVTLLEAPRIRLGSPEGRAGIAARMEIALLGNPPIPVEVTGNAGVRYDDQAKAFFLESPVADSVESVALRREFQPQVRRAVTQVMAAYFRDKPVYVLREDGSAEERAARWLLRRIRIETGKVVATLSPF